MFCQSEQTGIPTTVREANLSPSGKWETEYKLLTDGPTLTRIRQVMEAQKSVYGSPVDENLVNHYYDTPDYQLRRAGFSLRVRWNGSIWIQSIKQKHESSGGLFRRREWERTVSEGKPDFNDLERLQLPIATAQISPIFATRFRRQAFSLNTAPRHAADQPSAIRISLDEGTIEVGGLSLPIFEVELELESGPEAALRLIAQEFMTEFGLTPGHLSKAERAYLALRRQNAPEPP